MSADRETIVLTDGDSVARRVAEDFLSEIATAQRQFGAAHAVLTGGTLGIQLLEEAWKIVQSGQSEADLSRVDFWWGDERFVPADSDDRNEKQARSALLDPAGVPAERIHAMGSSDEFGSAEEAAAAYAEELAAHSSEETVLPRFDVLLLGMGPDGHIASLFPETGLIRAEGIVTAVHDSPKPPSDRVSLTLSTINSARRIWLAVSGEGKAPAVAAAFRGDPADSVPAGAVAGVESTRWYLDDAAYSQVDVNHR